MMQLDDKDMGSLNEDQKTAVMESLILAIVADARVSEAERERFEKEAERIPWGMSRDDLKSRMEAVRNRVVDLVRARNEEPIVRLINSIASRLTAPAFRDKLFRTMTAIMDAGDGLTIGEKNLMIVVANAFEITPERLDKIKADLA